MSHYFTADKPKNAKRITFDYYFKSTRFNFTTDMGVFSSGHVDEATDLMLRNIPPLSGSLLDLGCGCGCAGIVLAKTYGVTLTQSDVNPNALTITAENCQRNGIKSQLLLSNNFENIPESYDTIVLNPPIHAGKQVIFSMYEGAFEHLNSGGRLYLVIRKKHGAESTLVKLRGLFNVCEVICKEGNCFIIETVR